MFVIQQISHYISTIMINLLGKVYCNIRMYMSQAFTQDTYITTSSQSKTKGNIPIYRLQWVIYFLFCKLKVYYPVYTKDTGSFFSSQYKRNFNNFITQTSHHNKFDLH